MFRQDFTCPALLEDPGGYVAYGALTHSGRPFQAVLLYPSKATGLVRVRSPLLTESRLMSFPPANEMFQFAGFASPAYGFSGGSSLGMGLPHSEIRGSKSARLSPRLIAACHVLHRLSVPRHPPDALHSLRSTRHPPAARREQPHSRDHAIRTPGEPSLP